MKKERTAATLLLWAGAVALAVWLGLSIDYAKHKWFNERHRVEAQSDQIRSQEFWDAFDIASTTFIYCETGGAQPGQACSTGSADGDGWITVGTDAAKAVQIDIATINATSIEFIIEGRLFGAAAGANAQIWPATGDRSETAVGSFIVQVPDAVYEMRVGIKVTGDAGAQDVTATLNTFAPDAR